MPPPPPGGGRVRWMGFHPLAQLESTANCVESIMAILGVLMGLGRGKVHQAPKVTLTQCAVASADIFCCLFEICRSCPKHGFRPQAIICPSMKAMPRCMQFAEKLGVDVYMTRLLTVPTSKCITEWNKQWKAVVSVALVS